MKNICIVGLGRLGASFAACWAKRGFNVTGVDINTEILKKINAKEAPMPEPGLDETLKKHPFKAVDNILDGMATANVTFILVATPSTSSGRFSEHGVLKVCQSVGKGLQSKKYHVIVIASTVSPGTVEKTIIPQLEESSGKKCGPDFGVCYVPEWVALGNLIHGFLNPDLTLIGSTDKKCGDIVEELYKEFLENDPPIVRTDILNAELCKICLNVYVATKITFANTIAQICEQFPGADADVVTNTIGLDSRIGNKFFKGAMSYSGPCFVRDVPAMKALLEEVDEFPILPLAVDEMNKRRTQSLVKLIHRNSLGKTTAMLGLTFKPDTDIIENSASMWVVEELRDRCQMMNFYDPEAKNTPEWMIRHESLEKCIKNSHTIVVMTPWPEFKKIDPKLFENKTLIDCWRIYKDVELPESTKYVPLGKHTGT